MSASSSTSLCCVVEGCEAWAEARRLCSRHYSRWLAQGKPVDVASLGRLDRPNLSTSGRRGKYQDVVGYSAALRRVRTTRGPARVHSCVECMLTEAQRWTYVAGTDPDERVDVSNGFRYCLDPSLYEPRCVSCALRLRYRMAAL